MVNIYSNGNKVTKEGEEVNNNDNVEDKDAAKDLGTE